MESTNSGHFQRNVFQKLLEDEYVPFEKKCNFGKLIFSIDIYHYNNNVTFYHTNSNYCTTLQGRYHGERKDNDYPMANKKIRNIKLKNNDTTI